MGDLPPGAAHLAFDGRELHAGPTPGRCFMVDARCLEGEAIPGAYAHVCALTDPGAALPFDQPEIQSLRADVSRNDRAQRALLHRPATVRPGGGTLRWLRVARREFLCGSGHLWRMG
ncbi:MAG: hypothetical protein LC790_07235 [Actinobacteria bacterium]|nr:hypothetical protein [Actinomycetota bacterium]